LGFCFGSGFGVFSDVLFSQYVNTNNSDLKIPVFTVLPGNGAKIWLRPSSVVGSAKRVQIRYLCIFCSIPRLGSLVMTRSVHREHRNWVIGLGQLFRHVEMVVKLICLFLWKLGFVWKFICFRKDFN
jgi:hypothetical protein